MTSATNWDDFPRLAEEGPAMRLPRRSAPLNNILSNAARDRAMQEEASVRETRAPWDLLDYATALGVVLALAGLALSLVSETRRAGILTPLGLMIAVAAIYLARRKDEAQS